VSGKVYNIIVDLFYLMLNCFNSCSKGIPNIVTNVTKLTINILDFI
jgi:hypothetical protein